eukprot:TRINITY_DN27018_c1_g1_i1.p1 TRINITY_DN27018_c1_g1~~TRINITY_DN27018_c1_g1_i1.p1  ORF type:complete len:190 (-),score=23.72 TRINITY_DN27018_c1_g1_i1:80-598(-)
MRSFSLVLLVLALASSAFAFHSYKQCDDRWKNEKLGTSSVTICHAGCAMTSLAMITDTWNKNSTTYTPHVMNNWLKRHGGYASGDLLVWGAINKLPFISLNTRVRGNMEINKLRSYVNGGYGVIANVHNGGHWVLITSEKANGVFNVNDPGSSHVFTYNHSDMVGFAIYKKH